MRHANLEFMLLKLENAVIRLHVLLLLPLADPSYSLLTSVDAYVSSSSPPFLYSTAGSQNRLRL